MRRNLKRHWIPSAGAGYNFICINILKKSLTIHTHSINMSTPFDPVNSISLNPPEIFKKPNPKFGKSFTHKSAHSSVMSYTNTRKQASTGDWWGEMWRILLTWWDYAVIMVIPAALAGGAQLVQHHPMNRGRQFDS